MIFKGRISVSKIKPNFRNNWTKQIKTRIESKQVKTSQNESKRVKTSQNESKYIKTGQNALEYSRQNQNQLEQFHESYRNKTKSESLS